MLFNIGIISSRQHSIKTIGIGNLSLGGAGKSPLTIYLAELTLRNGYYPAIVSRGYGRRSKGLVIASANSSSSDIGDELMIYQSRFPEIPIIASEKRNEAVDFISANNKEVNVIILDDCYQHRKIKPSILLLLTPQQKPYWKDMLIPSGNLRDIKLAHKRADALIITKAKDPNTPIPYKHLKKCTFTSQILSSLPIPVNSGEAFKPGTTCIAFSGIADNQSFQNSLSDFSEITEFFNFSDHHNFTEAEINQILDSAASHNIQTVVTTEKDWFRLSESKKEILKRTKLYILPIQVTFYGDGFDEYVLSHINQAV